MPQVTWKGSITFGLVTVPVALYAATERHSGATLHQVHREDGGRIRMKRVCELDGEEVDYADVAKAFESPDGREVVLEEEDLAELPVPSKKVIDVLAFVDAERIDPIRFTTPYYVGLPAGTPAKPYQLLRDALRESGQVAVTKVTLQSRESLAVLRVQGDLLVLQTMRWPDEIRDASGIAPGGADQVRPQELRMARSLMDTLSEGFELDELHDDYAQAMEEVIAAKLEGAEPPRAAEKAPRGGKVIDLMEALRSSVEAARGEGAAGGASEGEDAGDGEPASGRGGGSRRTAAKKTAAKRGSAASKAGSSPKSGSGSGSAKKSTAKTAAKKAPAKKTASRTSRRRAS